MKSKNKLEENNSKNNQKNIKKRIYSSHYSINSLTKKVPIQEKKKYEESFNYKNRQLNQKRPASIYLNRNKLSFKSNITDSSNPNLDSNANPKIFYNCLSNELKTQNNININTNHNSDLNFLNEIYISKTTKNNDIKKQNIIKNINFENNSILNQNNLLINELNDIKVIWKEIYVSQEYQNFFEEMILNLEKEDEIRNILNNEKKQITQFKNELFKLLNVISKREKAIENLKKLDKSFIENKRLEKYNKIIVEKYKSDSDLNIENNYKNGELEEKNKKLIETDIDNCLKLLRINSVNAIHQFNKFRIINNHLITSGKIDVNKLKSYYGYNPDYLIKMKNDLDFLIYSNINLIYNFKTNDPFLTNLIPYNSENNLNFKKINASTELVSTINNCLYILAQEELIYKMKFKKDIKRNKSSGEYKSNNEEMNVKIKNIKKGKNFNYLKMKSKNEYNKLFFHHNKNSDLNMNMNLDDTLNKNGNRTKKIKNLYFNNELDINKKDNDKLNGIPITSALQLQKKFDFYNKLKQNLNNDKNENKKNENTKNEKESNSNEKEEGLNINENKNKDKKNQDEKENTKYYKDYIQEKNNDNKFNYIWFQDGFNKFKNIYNEYYNKLSKKTIEIFSLNENADEFICGFNPKIILCQKEVIGNKIYGICGISYHYDNNQLILKINHISSLEKDDKEEDNYCYQKKKMEFKIYEQFIELIKSLPYQIIELNLFVQEKDNEFLNYFINNYQFELYNNENNKENNNKNDNSERINNNNSSTKKVLRIYNNKNNDDYLKKLIISNEIQYNNTSILSLIEENQEFEQKKNVQKINMYKYFYKYINTFNLNILINFLSKDNVYSIKNLSNEKINLLSKDFSNYFSLFIKEKNNNSDNIINISPDLSLIETKDKIKYAYITSFVHIKLYPFITTIYNKLPYNIFKINIQIFNKDKNMFIIGTSDEKISIYIYKCEEESDLKKEINQNSNESFNIFEYFNKLIFDKNKDEKDESNENYKNGNNKLLWIPSFSIDTQLVCDKIPILKDIVIENNDKKKLEIKEYTEILKIKYGIEEFNEKGIIYEPNIEDDIIIEKDFIFAITHKDIKNQFNNSIVFLAYVTKDNFINIK